MVAGLPGTVYPGWRVMAGSFIGAVVAVGFTSYIFGLFVIPVTSEFGLARADFNSVMIAFMLGNAIMAPIVGNLLDRFSARLLIVLGGFSFGAALMIASRLDSAWGILALITVPLTFGMCACGNLGANTVVVRWFRNRRGRALGLLAISTSVGGFLSQPLTALLIERYGWRDALFLIGAGACVVFLLVAILLVRNRPSGKEPGYDAEFAQADEAAQQAGVSARPERTWTNAQLLRNRNFWLLTLALGMLFATEQAVMVSSASLFQDMGLDLRTAALVLSVKSLSAIGGKIIIGLLADKVDLRLLYVYVGGSAMLLLGVYIVQPPFWLLLASVALLGVAVGGLYPLWATLMAWLFGAGSYGKMMGLAMIFMQPIAMVAIRFVGSVYDRTGGYGLAFGVFIGLLVLSVGMVLLLRPEPAKARSGELATTAA